MTFKTGSRISISIDQQMERTIWFGHARATNLSDDGGDDDDRRDENYEVQNCEDYDKRSWNDMSAVAAVGVDGIPSTDDPDFGSFWIVRSVRLSQSKQSFLFRIFVSFKRPSSRKRLGFATYERSFFSLHSHAETVRSFCPKFDYPVCISSTRALHLAMTSSHQSLK